jgi:hypothetical protein
MVTDEYLVTGFPETANSSYKGEHEDELAPSVLWKQSNL